MLLGLMEPSKHTVSCLDYSVDIEPHDYDDDGNYRWPFGLELKTAWRFVDPLVSLASVSTRPFTMDSALGIVPLEPSEEATITALPRTPAALLRPLTAAARIEGTEAARRRAAPPPTTTRQGVMHMRRMSAFTYAMEIENANQAAFKIGWSFDYGARARQFNLLAASPWRAPLPHSFYPVVGHGDQRIPYGTSAIAILRRTASSGQSRSRHAAVPV